MTLMSLPDFSSTMRPNRVDDTRFTRRSVITALELRLFHQADSKGIVRFPYQAKDNIVYTTAVKLAGDRCLCPCCGELCDELTHHPGDRGLCCPACIQRLASSAKRQARRKPATRRTARKVRVAA